MVRTDTEVPLDIIVKNTCITRGSVSYQRRVVLPSYDNRWDFYGEKPELAFLDLTDMLNEFLSEWETGTLLVWSPHTTMAILANEYGEEGYRHDTANWMQKMFPADAAYQHNIDHKPPNCTNGHSHLMANLLPHNQVVPFSGGELDLHHYKRIFALDLYPHEEGKERFLTIAINGEPAPGSRIESYLAGQ